MPAQVVFIGLDAAEPDLVEGFAADGTMPGIARLIEQGTTVPLRSAPELPGAMWSELATGQFGSRSGIYFPPGQVINGSAALERMKPDYLDAESWFWAVASRAGLRAASIDMVHTALSPCDAFEVVEWGSHDRMISPTASSPANALAELEARHGRYPVDRCDSMHHCVASGYRRLGSRLLDAADLKTELALDVLGRERWDVFSVVFSETHCACHQLWHLHDPSDRRHPRRCPDDLAGSFRAIHGRVDAGVARVIEAAGPDAQIVVAAIKGTRGEVGGPQLVSEVLATLELSARRSWKGRLWDHTPVSVKGQLSRVPQELRNRLAVSRDPGFRGAEGRARALRNDQSGAVRLNVKGRDPGGVVEPGGEEEGLLDLLESSFRELRVVGSGRPAVADVVRVRERYGEAAHPDLPDLLIVFDHTVGFIDDVESDRLGRLRRPFNNVRSGNHTGNARAWIRSPSVERGITDERAVCDVTASVLTLAGVQLPDKYDGSASGLVVD